MRGALAALIRTRSQRQPPFVGRFMPRSLANWASRWKFDGGATALVGLETSGKLGMTNCSRGSRVGLIELYWV